jgi:hypothetical protein
VNDGYDDDHGNQAPSAAGQADERTHDPETVPLDLDEGDDVVIGQMPVGAEQVLGSGEFPDPDAPPQDPAPGG